MSAHLKEKEEKILRIIENIREESAKGSPIVVEGKKDVDTLNALGIEGPIISLKTGGKSLIDAFHEIERTGKAEIILLLDYDRRGREATSHLKRNLEKARKKPQTKYWHDLFGLLGKEIQCVESLTAYLTTLQKRIAI